MVIVDEQLDSIIPNEMTTAPKTTAGLTAMFLLTPPFDEATLVSLTSEVKLTSPQSARSRTGSAVCGYAADFPVSPTSPSVTSV